MTQEKAEHTDLVLQLNQKNSQALQALQTEMQTFKTDFESQIQTLTRQNQALQASLDDEKLKLVNQESKH